MKQEYYRIEFELRCLISQNRINKLEELKDKEVFFSEKGTIIKGQLPDQSALTAFIKVLRDSGLEILKLYCEKTSSDEET